MALPGLVANKNLSDVTNIQEAWNNLGNGLTATVSGTSASIVITGRDILALNNVRSISSRDFVLLKGLSSNAQTRINTIFSQTNSATVLRDRALPKASPSSIGNFAITRGSLTANNLQINGVSIGSLSTSPFSGNTAITSLLFSSLKLSSVPRLNEAMISGAIASPTIAMPIEAAGFILYAKMGQN